MSTIHDLYHDNLCLADRLYNKNSELYKLQMKLTGLVDDFTKNLNEEQKKGFLKIDDMATKVSSMLQFDSFQVGLKFGVRLMNEIFQEEVPEWATFPLR